MIPASVGAEPFSSSLPPQTATDSLQVEGHPTTPGEEDDPEGLMLVLAAGEEEEQEEVFGFELLSFVPV
jgi:hypothetical protein